MAVVETDKLMTNFTSTQTYRSYEGKGTTKHFTVKWDREINNNVLITDAVSHSKSVHP